MCYWAFRKPRAGALGSLTECPLDIRPFGVCELIHVSSQIRRFQILPSSKPPYSNPPYSYKATGNRTASQRAFISSVWIRIPLSCVYQLCRDCIAFWWNEWRSSSGIMASIFL